MSVDRRLGWDGFHNARDLGGLPTRSGGTTRYGAFVRSAGLQFVTDAGWQAARNAGVRTIVDLRNDDEIRAEKGVPPVSLGFTRVWVPLDDASDVEFWNHVDGERLNGSPLYYPLFLERKSARCAAIITALAGCADGGVLFHCSAGRDRTGLVTLLLLALADVEAEVIAADYELSTVDLVPVFALLGMEDQGPIIQAHVDGLGTTLRELVLATLDGFDVSSYLLQAGVAAADIACVRARLLGLPAIER